MKEKFDKKFPGAKMLREYELRKTARELFNKSAIGRATSVIYLVVALISIFIYWKFFDINIFLSIIFGIITWFVVTYIFDKALIKLSGVEKIVKKLNDEEIGVAGMDFEDKTGVSMDKLLK